MLAVLLWERGPVSGSALIEKVWGDEQPNSVHATLHSNVSRLRRNLRRGGRNPDDGGLLRSGSSGTYSLDVAPGEVDFRVFRALVGRATSAAASGDFEQAVALFREADQLWRGVPLADLSGSWVEGVRMRLEEEGLTAALDCLDAELHLGRHASLVGKLRDLAAQHPLNERAVRLLMLALHGSGRMQDVSQVYLKHRRLMLDELGSDPTPGLDKLYRQMLGDAPETNGRRPARRAESAGLVPPPRTASTLPRDNPDFTGRAAELGLMASWLNSGEGRSTVPVILISGMPGVGKSSLAVHAAHLFSRQYTRQIHLELRAHSAAAPPQGPALPLDPATALGAALRALGIPTDQIPASLDDRLALWRSRAHGILLVLDDALNSGQVLPLLPSAPGCAVLVTSRLRAHDIPGLRALPIETLPPADAAALFTKIAGPEHASDPDGLASVLALCGHLPYRIQLMASLLRRHQRAWSIRDLIERMHEIRAEEGDMSASLELSYRYLMPDQQQLLRRLALHPDGSFSGYAGAALAGGAQPLATQRAIEALADYHLIEEPARGYFTFHDLIHQYAQRIAEDRDPEAGRRQAIGRLLDYYVSLAERADMLVHPFHQRIVPPSNGNGTSAAPVLPELRTRQDSKKWLEGERRSLLHAARYALDSRFYWHAGLLPHLLARFLDDWADWAEAIDLHGVSASAWQALGNASGEARALSDLGFALGQVGRYDEARGHAQRALTIARQAGITAGEAGALSTLGVLSWRQARYPEALDRYDEALALWRSLGNQHGEAETLHRRAVVSWQLRRAADSQREAEQALAIFRTLGDPQGEVNALNNLTGMHLEAGSYEQALRNFRQVPGMFRELGDRQGEAMALSNIGELYSLTGRYAEAIDHYRTAADELRNLGDRRSQAEALIGMGVVFRQSRDYAAAIDVFQKALVIAHDLAEKYLQVQVYLGLGETREQSGGRLAAAGDFEAALELSEQIGDPDSATRARRGVNGAR
ncbi:MAG TPA: tetratricopeptide repeat protein [Trebonia sp.]|nr:tetratricopeptide repeat protein [Trebonia sp.]